MNFEQLVEKAYEDYINQYNDYKKREDYYNDKFDILQTYNTLSNRSNQIIIINYISSFIDREVSYAFGKKLNYIPKSEDKEIIDVINKETAHFSIKHEQDLALNLSIYKKVFELCYINNNGQFSTKIINPTQGYLCYDDYGNKQFFLYAFNKKFDDTNYIDVFTDNKIIHYKLSKFNKLDKIGESRHYFNEVPVSETTLNRTVYDIIKTLNDSLCWLVSDSANIISDFRVAYLTITGADITEEDLAKMKELGVLVIPTGGEIGWLLKNVNDQYIMNQINTYVDKMYELTGHINNNAVPPSNNTGQATRARYTSLEQRCQNLIDSVLDLIYNRLRLLFKYVKIKTNKEFNYFDIEIKQVPNIPYDLLTLSQFISQIGENMSLESKLSMLPMISNPELEIEKLKKEQEGQIDLDLLNSLLEKQEAVDADE